MNGKALTTALITLLILTMSSQLILTVKADDVEITSILPETHMGKVGETVRVVGTINTTNGLYQIWFENMLMVNETATENNVNASFLVPSLPQGNYTLTLLDTTANINATSWFFIETAYHLHITKPTPPEQLQENATVEISISVTGGEPNTIYAANITVEAPAPSNETYWVLVSLNTNDTGIGNATVTYPQAFSGAHTNYTGTYTVSVFNETDTFFVGLTDRTEYHRFQTVDIKASGYQPEENVTLTITGENLYYSESLNASAEGVIHYANSSVLSNARIGTYMVNITSTFNVTVKTPPDIQNFTVPGFNINITALNLAEEPVPDVALEIFENEMSVVNATSGSDGLASVKLEIGNYTANVYFKEKKVGEHWINVTESSLSFDVTCNLTNLMVLVLTVVDGRKFSMPEVRLSLSPENLTSTPNLNTNITGLAVFHNLFLDVNYTLNASRYETQFNTTTLYGLLQDGNPVAWFNLTILCPTYTLQVNVTNPNANDQPINNALVKIQEVMGGLNFENATTIDGTAIFNTPLGNYTVQVYFSGIKLNETFVLLNESFIDLPISCKLYGLNIAIQVVDYFGQPIPNANVTLSLDGLQRWNLTKSDGIAEFSDAIGGNLQVAVYLPGQSQPYLVSPLYVDGSKTIQIKIERYTVLAGFLVETSHSVMLIIIVVSLIVLLLLEVYRRRRLKPKTSKSES